MTFQLHVHGMPPNSSLPFMHGWHAGVIVESEEVHRLAYNAAFANFDVRIPGQGGTVDWSVEFYNVLQVCMCESVCSSRGGGA